MTFQSNNQQRFGASPKSPRGHRSFANGHPNPELTCCRVRRTETLFSTPESPATALNNSTIREKGLRQLRTHQLSIQYQAKLVSPLIHMRMLIPGVFPGVLKCCSENPRLTCTSLSYRKKDFPLGDRNIESLSVNSIEQSLGFTGIQRNGQSRVTISSSQPRSKFPREAQGP